jgi:capsule polysaccharide export protein KpsE/RkpR
MYAQLVQQLSAPLLGPVASGAAPETIYVEMLKSRTLGEQIIDEFGLMKAYKADRIEEALDGFHSHFAFNLLDNGLLIFSFEDRDPERAAQITNRMTELLDQITRDLKIGRAARTRTFVEEQVKEREELLAAAETELKEFQQTHNTVDIDEQLRSAMDLITELSARAIALETEMQIMEHYTSTSSEEYQRKQTEYREVVRQLTKLKSHGEGDKDMVRSFIPTLDEVPEVALQYIRLRRAVEVQTAVYTMLINEYEKARIEEARDTPPIQVLDPAQAPTIRSRPQRKLVVLAGAMLGLGWATVIALVGAMWREGRGNAGIAREVLQPVVDDFRRLRRRRNRS